MTHDVFISYSSADKTVADAVCARLESEKIRCWIAPRDVPAGKPYAASLIEAISQSSVFVLVLSKGSNSSDHVLREVAEAIDNGIPILPFRIDDVEPSRQMRYYIQSIHWLDALTPPLEKHLNTLCKSVNALLFVADEQPIVAVKPQIAPPMPKARSFPKWGIVAILIVGIMVIVGFGIWALFQSSLISQQVIIDDTDLIVEKQNAPTTQGTSPMVTEAEILNATPTQEILLTATESEWRVLSFNIPDELLWHQPEDGSYTAVYQTTETAFAWSDEIIEGDFTLKLDITSDGDPIKDNNDGCEVLVYGDGRGFSYGNLLLHIGFEYYLIEKHFPWHEGENYLAVTDSNLNMDGQTYHVDMEIINNKASISIDGRKVASAPIDDEILRSGRIALVKFWESRVECTFSNIRIKALYNMNE